MNRNNLQRTYSKNAKAEVEEFSEISDLEENFLELQHSTNEKERVFQ